MKTTCIAVALALVVALVAADSCLPAYRDFFGDRVGKTPSKNEDMYYCTWYKEKTCCEKEPTLVAKHMSDRYQSGLFGDYTGDCQYYYQLHECRYCHPDFGTGYGVADASEGKICKNYYESWYEACKETRYVSHTYNLAAGSQETRYYADVQNGKKLEDLATKVDSAKDFYIEILAHTEAEWNDLSNSDCWSAASQSAIPTSLSLMVALFVAIFGVMALFL